MATARIKKNDLVTVVAGGDKGKTGTVIDICYKKQRVLIKGVCLQIKHVKARRKGDVGAIKSREGFIAMSKVMPVCSYCKKPSRVGFSKNMSDGVKARICCRCKNKI